MQPSTASPKAISAPPERQQVDLRRAQQDSPGAWIGPPMPSTEPSPSRATAATAATARLSTVEGRRHGRRQRTPRRGTRARPRRSATAVARYLPPGPDESLWTSIRLRPTRPANPTSRATPSRPAVTRSPESSPSRTSTSPTNSRPAATRSTIVDVGRQVHQHETGEERAGDRADRAEEIDVAERPARPPRALDGDLGHDRPDHAEHRAGHQEVERDDQDRVERERQSTSGPGRSR